MKRKAFWLGGISGVLLAVAALVIVAFANSGPATAQTSGSQVPEALKQALVATSVPVTQITPIKDDRATYAYLTVLKDAATSNYVNSALAFEQATALAAKGMPIDFLQVQVVDASGQVCFDEAGSLDPSSVRVGSTPDQAAMSLAQTGLTSAVDSNLSILPSSLRVRRGDVTVGQIGNGLVLAKVGFQAPDTWTAKAAFDAQLVQQTVESCRKIAATLSVGSIRVTMIDAYGTTLLDYWESLESGSIEAYFAHGIGDGWRFQGPGRKCPANVQGTSP